MSLSEALAKVQTLAATEEKGDNNEYSIYTIRELQLAAETSERTSRLNFQVTSPLEDPLFMRKL